MSGQGLGLDAEACRVLMDRGYSATAVREYLDKRQQADLRMQIAMAALPAIQMSSFQENRDSQGGPIYDVFDIVRGAFATADAMLAEAKK